MMRAGLEGNIDIGTCILILGRLSSIRLSPFSFSIGIANIETHDDCMLMIFLAVFRECN